MKTNENEKEKYKSTKLASNFKLALEELDEVVLNIKTKEKLELKELDTSNVLLSILILEGFVKSSLIKTGEQNEIISTRIPSNFIMLSIEKILTDFNQNKLDKKTLKEKVSFYVRDYISKKLSPKENEDISKMSDSSILNNLTKKNNFISDVLAYYKGKEHLCQILTVIFVYRTLL